jgi:hypothetical protein
MCSQPSGAMRANSLSCGVSPWPDARRAANISASKPLCYLLKSSATKAVRQTGLERATLYGEIRARDA